MTRANSIDDQDVASVRPAMPGDCLARLWEIAITNKLELSKEPDKSIGVISLAIVASSYRADGPQVGRRK